MTKMFITVRGVYAAMTRRQRERYDVVAISETGVFGGSTSDESFDRASTRLQMDHRAEWEKAYPEGYEVVEIPDSKDKRVAAAAKRMQDLYAADQKAKGLDKPPAS